MSHACPDAISIGTNKIHKRFSESRCCHLRHRCVLIASTSCATCSSSFPTSKAQGRPGPLRVEQLVDDLFRDYRINNQCSLDDVRARWRLHLKPFLGSVPAAELDSRLLERYIDARREEHATNATINRELACLKRMYRLAYLATPPRVPSVPHFPHLKENNVRQGFVTPEQFAKLVAQFPDLWLRAMLETAYNYGWRVSELLNLRVGQVDLVARTIRLDRARPRTRKGVRSRSSLERCSSCFATAWRASARRSTCSRAVISPYVTSGRAGRTSALLPEHRPFSSMTCAGQRHGTCAPPAYRRKSSCALRDGRLRVSSSDTRS
jgi:hypothetical protein